MTAVGFDGRTCSTEGTGEGSAATSSSGANPETSVAQDVLRQAGTSSDTSFKAERVPEYKCEDRPIDDLMAYLHQSPTAWHATDEARLRLRERGFVELADTDAWDLQPGGKYFTTKDNSSFVAWIMPTGDVVDMRILGAHTDSPAFKFKPEPFYDQEGQRMIGVEKYGGPSVGTWFDRPLRAAGRYFTKEDGELKEKLFDSFNPIASMVNIAIHLDGSLREGAKYNIQKNCPAVAGDPELTLSKLTGDDVVSHDLFLVPSARPASFGDRILSYRLDNLLGTHASILAIIGQKPAEHCVKMVACWDHEEVGSESVPGAAGQLLGDVISAVCGHDDARERQVKSASLLISNDVAHAVLPTRAEEHEPRHKPAINGSPVIKYNSQQRYATNARTAGILKDVAAGIGIKLQEFVVRSDKGCGSTIGPIASTRTGIPTIDIGEPIWSMHSAQETGSASAHKEMCKLLTAVLDV